MSPALLRASSDAMTDGEDPVLRRLGWQLDALADEVEAGMWPDVNDPRAVAEDWMGQ